MEKQAVGSDQNDCDHMYLMSKLSFAVRENLQSKLSFPYLLIIFSGLALLLVEFLAIPGFGIFGIAGLIILFYGLYLLLIPEVPVSDEIYREALDGFSWAIVGGIIVLIMLIRLISQSKVFQKLITQDSNKTTLKKNYDKRSKV